MRRRVSSSRLRLRRLDGYALNPAGIYRLGREIRMTEIVDQNHPRDWSRWYLLLLIPFIGVLWVPFYNFAEPYLNFDRQPPPANYVRLTSYTANNESGPFKVGLPLFKPGTNYRRWI